jgi:hypothetical protein
VRPPVKILVLWTYIANFGGPSEHYVDAGPLGPSEDALRDLLRRYYRWTEDESNFDFVRKCELHVFYVHRGRQAHLKISGSELWPELADESD